MARASHEGKWLRWMATTAYELRRSAMSTNASNLSTINAMFVYSILWFYGIFTTAVLLYFYQQFTATKRLMVDLQEEWETLQSAVSIPMPIPAPAAAKIPASLPR